MERSDRPRHRFSPAELSAARGTLVHLAAGDGGAPRGASAAVVVAAPPERVWSVVSDIASYAGRIPMIHRIRKDGDRVTLQLRFKVALFSFGFEVIADAARDDSARWLELRYQSGEPRDMHLRMEVSEAPGVRGSVVHTDIGFDIHSLGWLVKTFLRHHPEITFGVFPGSAIVLLDSMRRAIEEGDSPAA